jgi:hypothetical protein
MNALTHAELESTLRSAGVLSTQIETREEAMGDGERHGHAGYSLIPCRGYANPSTPERGFLRVSGGRYGRMAVIGETPA